MSNVQQETAVAVRMQDLSPEYAEIMVLGKVLQMSGYFTDVRDQAQAVTKILYGRELGFSPIISMSGIHIIEGKPALSANLLAAIIKRSGKYNYRVKEWDDKHCVITFKEKIGDTWEDVGDSSFSIDDAVRAKVKFKSANGHDTTWAKYPKAMLWARALSQGERAYCPDVSACPLYVPEELGATVNENGEVLSTQDLSKSARPVEVTTEEIRLGSPTLSSTSGVTSTPVKTASDGGGTLTAPAAQPITTTGTFVTSKDEVLPFYDQVVETVKAKQEKPKNLTYDGCIDQGRQIAFARSWKNEFPKGTPEKDIDLLRHDWLTNAGFVTPEGEPSSSMIPMALFEDYKRKAVHFARTLNQKLPSDGDRPEWSI